MVKASTILLITAGTLILLWLCNVIDKLQEESTFREEFYRELYAKNQELEKELRNYQSEIRKRDKQLGLLTAEKKELEKILCDLEA